MGTWVKGTTSEADIGLFPSSTFKSSKWDSQWTPISWNWSGLSRNKGISTSSSSQVGGSPMSGPEIDYLKASTISSNANLPTPLFGLRYPNSDGVYKRVVVVKAVKVASGNAQVVYRRYADYVDIKCMYYVREYSDETTFTETVINTQYVQPTRIYNPEWFMASWKYHLEYFYDSVSDDLYAGISNFGIITDIYNNSWDFSNYWLWMPVKTDFENAIHTTGQPEGEVTSPEFGKAAKRKGGYNPRHSRKGTFDDSSDRITVSSAPTLSAFGSGLMHAYKVTNYELTLLSRAMYPDLIFNAASVTDALGSLFNAIFMSKYVDFMLDLMILPLNVPTSGTENMRVGGKELVVADGAGASSKIPAARVSDQYVEVNCGSITIPEYWANFLDFSGTRFKLFLPYIGYVDIQPEYVNGGNLKVWYRFNVLDGSFMCYVESTSGHSELDQSLIGQYSGVAAMHIPLQSTDYSNKVSGLISSMGAVIAGAASSGMSGAVGYGAAASMVNTVIAKPGSSHANAYNASSSFLSHRKPYLIIERQSSQFSEKYPEEKGLPLYVMETIGNCQGLTICDNPHLDTIPATMAEKEKIYKYLTEGIIV